MSRPSTSTWTRSRPGASRRWNARPQGLPCKTAVHICYGYGIKANIDWKAALGAEWRQYEATFPVLAASKIDQVSLECRNSHVPLRLLRLLAGKDVLVGAIDVATDAVETPDEVAAVIEEAAELRAARAPVPLHQLRHGADARARWRRRSSRRSARAPPSPASGLRNSRSVIDFALPHFKECG